MTSLYVTNEKGDFKPTPSGMHLARCYRIIDIGTQKGEYKGQVNFNHKVMIGWELFGEDNDGNPLKMDDGKPMGMWKTYTLSWSEKATLRQHLQSWRGKPFTPEELRKFDLKNVLGAFCMLNVVHELSTDGSGKIFSKISTVSPVPKVVKDAGLPAPVNKNTIFSIAEPDMELFNSLSDNTKQKIQGSPEWIKLHTQQTPERHHPPMTKGVAGQGTDEDDDIPFN
jgi:hypothetical protein